MMTSSARFIRCALVMLVLISVAATARARDVAIDVDPAAAPRVKYGAWKLTDAVQSVIVSAGSQSIERIVIRSADKSGAKAEGFSLSSHEPEIHITGNDDSGTLYGCLELARRIRATKKLPTDLHVTDAPAFILRGPCIGMQKTYILPGRKVYEYPYTPELFPFFYDKQFWQEYLDFLAQNRMNTLYVWAGHPFASLVRVKDYPYAIEVDDATFAKNVEMYQYIARECDRRGITLVQMFYNILLSKPFAEHNGLETQLSSPTPVAADYTRKSIAEFVKQYPHVGLMVCLGEALQGIENQESWLIDVIIPGIHEGMQQAGVTREPLLLIRTHATDLRQYLPDALKLYKNIATEAKYNGESLTTWEPRGVRQQVHLAMSKLAPVHLINVHILANLEPFRYSAPQFIKKCVIAGRDRLGARGLHLYPLSYWNWPDSPDNVEPPLKQWDRDRIWFEAWARYSWNPDIDDASDRAYWVSRLSELYGSSKAAAKILDAYNDSGECAPRILRRFGITEGNRQTLSLGMTLDELVDPKKYRAFEELWESQSPPGERLQEYVDREWNHQPHEGETPPQIIRDVLDYSEKAVDEIDAAAPDVTSHRDEFDRLRNDIHCIRAMSQSYAAKANAAMCVLRYEHSHEISDMEHAESSLAESLDHFRELTRLTEKTYQFANSMQTSQRRIPVPGGANGKPANYHWSQLLPVYEKELADFQQKVRSLKSGVAAAQDESTVAALPKVSISTNAQTYEVADGAKVFSDHQFTIKSIAPELKGLTGIRISRDSYESVEFEAAEPVQILVGYFKSDDKRWRKPPNLETDAAAVERGGGEPLIRNAVTIDQLPPVDVYAIKFDKGRHKLNLPGGVGYSIVGDIPQSAKLQARDGHRKGGQ
jgi:hypothetical protein